MSTADLIKPGAIFKYEGGMAGWYEARGISGQIITTKEGRLLDKAGISEIIDPAVGDTVAWHVSSNRFVGKVLGITHGVSKSGVTLSVEDASGQHRMVNSDRLEVLKRAVSAPTQSSKLGGKKLDRMSIDEMSGKPDKPPAPKPNHYGSW